MSQAQDDLVARASDPNAELTTLHELANNYPGLRPYIAENPRTYPSLLEWLGSLGDPAVDAALARRNLASATVAVDQSTVRAAVALAETASPTQASGSGVRRGDDETISMTSGWKSAEPEPSSQVQAATHQQPAVQEPPYQQPAPVRPIPNRQGVLPGTTYQNPQPQPTGFQQGATAYQQPTGFQQGTAAYQQPTGFQQGATAYQQPTGFQQGTAAGAAGTAGAAYQQARPAEAPDWGAHATSADVVAEERDRRSGMWLWILAGIVVVVVVALVVWFMTSDRGDDAAAAATTAAAQPTRATQQSTSEAGQTPSPSASATPEIIAPAPDGATTMSAFTTPSGNISCTLGEDSVSCTINAHDFIPADPSCGNASALPFTISVGESGDAAGNCSGTFSSQGATLNYSSSAASDLFACTSLESGVECWSQVSGQGFRLSRQNVESMTR